MIHVFPALGAVQCPLFKKNPYLKTPYLKIWATLGIREPLGQPLCDPLFENPVVIHVIPALGAVECPLFKKKPYLKIRGFRKSGISRIGEKPPYFKNRI